MMDECRLETLMEFERSEKRKKAMAKRILAERERNDREFAEAYFAGLLPEVKSKKAKKKSVRNRVK